MWALVKIIQFSLWLKAKFNLKQKINKSIKKMKVKVKEKKIIGNIEKQEVKKKPLTTKKK